MRLVISRSQQDIKGMLGGHKGVQFTINFRLELTGEEAELVRRHKLADYVVTTRVINGGPVPFYTIGNLLQGQSQTVSDVTTLVKNERVVTDACDELPLLFDVCRSFGGNEVIDYPRQASDRVPATPAR